MEKWIRLQGLRLELSIGIHDFERAGPQAYLIDISLGLSADYVTHRDEIEETVDYDTLRTRVVQHATSKHFNLQETLIQDVVRICFDLDPRVQTVDVTTGKTSVYPDCDMVGLHYIVQRAEHV